MDFDHLHLLLRDSPYINEKDLICTPFTLRAVEHRPLNKILLAIVESQINKDPEEVQLFVSIQSQCAAFDILSTVPFVQNMWCQQ